MEITGLEGPMTIARALATASSTSGVGAAARDVAEVDVLDGPRRPGG